MMIQGKSISKEDMVKIYGLLDEIVDIVEQDYEIDYNDQKALIETCRNVFDIQYFLKNGEWIK